MAQRISIVHMIQGISMIQNINMVQRINTVQRISMSQGMSIVQRINVVQRTGMAQNISIVQKIGMVRMCKNIKFWNAETKPLVDTWLSDFQLTSEFISLSGQCQGRHEKAGEC
jgi:hypothetical protein